MFNETLSNVDMTLSYIIMLVKWRGGVGFH